MKIRFYRIILALASLCIGGNLPAGDQTPSPYHQVPVQKPDPLVAEIQIDDFSCGFHALSAIYKSHQLDPVKARLKARLGTNVSAVPFVQDAKGTLQPDIFRVLNQDGFDTHSIDNFTTENLAIIHDHLAEQFVLSLFKMHEGGMHWVVFTASDGEKVTVADSLKPTPQQVSLQQFSEEQLLHAILIFPSEPKPGSPFFAAHLSGIKYMAFTSWAMLPWILKLIIPVSVLLLILCVPFVIGRGLRKRRKSRAGAEIPG